MSILKSFFSESGIPQTILSQLGASRFIKESRTKILRPYNDKRGTKTQCPFGNALLMNVTSGKDRILFVNIVLLPSDTYLMEFLTNVSGTLEEVLSFSDVYCDELCARYTEATGIEVTEVQFG